MFENEIKAAESVRNAEAELATLDRQRYENLAKTTPFTHSLDHLRTIYKSSASNGGKILKLVNNDLICTQPKKKCACFACGHHFLASEWTRAMASDEEIIVMCPACAVDAILIDGDGYEITDALVDDLHRLYFA